MPRLSELTDAYYNDPTANPAALPVEKPFADLKKVYITGEPELPVKFSEEPSINEPSALSNNIDKFLNAFFRDDEKRLQLWPERVLREGATAAGKVASGEVSQWAIDPVTGDVHTSPQMVEKAQELSALAGSGGLASGGGSLNATPSLRPALRHKEKLYKGKPGQEHQDIIPNSLYDDFRQKAMTGEDLAEYNFGFVNDKRHFLSREDALKYGIDNGIIDPHAGKFGTLTSTMFADSSKPGAAIEAMKAQPFYSALEHNISAIPQAKMNGEAWLGTLSNKPGIKPEELQWTGLADFLAENKGKPVTKAQIEEHLAANKVELKEVSKGVGYTKDDINKEAIRIANAEKGKRFNQLSAKEKEDLLIEAEDRLISFGSGKQESTKYHSYQLPGGENYREMLLTLPSEVPKHQATQKANDARIRELRDSMHGTSGSNEIRSEMSKLQNENQSIQQKIRDANLYKSSHWDEPNILAHVRINDRTIDGKKSLHLEEIQSDWHQAGRDKGYKEKGQSAKIPEGAEVYQPDPDKFPNAWVLRSKQGRDLTERFHATDKSDALSTAASKTDEALRNAVPDAPFKKTWHELALKRMLREASEKGYDRLSWTPGEAQAARYDLSKSISDLELHGTGSNMRLSATDKNGNKVIDMKHVTKDNLADNVGKDVAEKLLAMKEPDPKNPYAARRLAGQDLKIGGEGMKGFYDNMIPKSLEKLGKEHGVKVKKGEINPKSFSIKEEKLPTGRSVYDIMQDGKLYSSFQTKAEAQAHIDKQSKSGNPVYYIDIPQSLKDTATQKGFPLFSKGGYMFQPVDFDPFAGKTELKT